MSRGIMTGSNMQWAQATTNITRNNFDTSTVHDFRVFLVGAMIREHTWIGYAPYNGAQPREFRISWPWLTVLFDPPGADAEGPPGQGPPGPPPAPAAAAASTTASAKAPAAPAAETPAVINDSMPIASTADFLAPSATSAASAPATSAAVLPKAKFVPTAEAILRGARSRGASPNASPMKASPNLLVASPPPQAAARSQRVLPCLAWPR